MQKMLVKSNLVMVILGLGLLAACAPTPSPQDVSEMGVPVYFPQLEPMEEMPLALIYGVLINEEGCLRVIASEGSESYLVLWPADVNLVIEGEDISIHDSSGELVARVGQQIGLVGGEYDQREWAAERLQPGHGLPEDCTGPFWLSGEIVEPEG